MSRQPRRNKTNFKYLYLPPSLPMLQAAPASSTADRRQPVPPSQQAKLVEYAQLPHGVMRIPRPLPHMVRRWEASPTMMASHDAWSYCGRCIRSATRKHSYIYIHMNIYLSSVLDNLFVAPTPVVPATSFSASKLHGNQALTAFPPLQHSVSHAQKNMHKPRHGSLSKKACPRKHAQAKYNFDGGGGGFNGDSCRKWANAPKWLFCICPVFPELFF